MLSPKNAWPWNFWDPEHFDPRKSMTPKNVDLKICVTPVNLYPSNVLSPWNLLAQKNVTSLFLLCLNILPPKLFSLLQLNPACLILFLSHYLFIFLYGCEIVKLTLCLVCLSLVWRWARNMLETLNCSNIKSTKFCWWSAVCLVSSSFSTSTKVLKNWFPFYIFYPLNLWSQQICTSKFFIPSKILTPPKCWPHIFF